eukprot:scaffold23485_cov35-Attheya_sp.AAC.1
MDLRQSAAAETGIVARPIESGAMPNCAITQENALSKIGSWRCSKTADTSPPMRLTTTSITNERSSENDRNMRQRHVLSSNEHQAASAATTSDAGAVAVAVAVDRGVDAGASTAIIATDKDGT